MKQSLEMLGQQNHFFGRKHSDLAKVTISQKKKLSKQEILDRLNKRNLDFSFDDFNYENYISRQHQKIICVCRKCGKLSNKTLQSLERGTLCKFCYPFTVSKGELEMGNYISTKLHKDIIRNNRKLIAPYELDIYIPDLNLAFEYHGLYWHMDKKQNGFDKNLHYKKHILCKDKGVTLLQFFSNEWEEKQLIIKSMIANKLGMSVGKIGARKTRCMEISMLEAKDFFNINHLHGHVRASKAFALIDKKTDEILSVISLRTAFHKKYSKSIELARFSTKLNYNVIGGFSKLLKSCIIPYSRIKGYKSIISYADLLTGTGNVYNKNGFEYISHTGINYWYTDGKYLFNRFKFRATKEFSEKEIAIKNNVYKIYGCGNSLFEYKIK